MQSSIYLALNAVIPPFAEKENGDCSMAPRPDSIDYVIQRHFLKTPAFLKHEIRFYKGTGGGQFV